MARRRDGAFEFRQQFFGHDQQPRPRILEHEGVIVLGHQRVDRNRDNAGLDGAEERGRPVDGVEQADQDALLAADAERAQHMAEALDALGKLAIGAGAAVIDEGGFAAAAGVEIALEDIGGEIVIARDRGRGRSATHRGVSSRGMRGRCPPMLVPWHYADGEIRCNPIVMRHPEEWSAL